jgi:lipopolysaccharide export system ATP-binding protein
VSLLFARGLRVEVEGRALLGGVDLEVGPGEVLGVLGPNGAGKTTLFRALLGDVDAAGEVLLEGRSLAGLPLHARARLGLAWLPQEEVWFPELDLGDNVALAAELSGSGRGAAGCLARVGLAGLGARRVGTLSGGERRRAAFARALAQGARVILLDEPFAGVDPLGVVELRALLRDLAATGIGLVLTDHAVDAALEACDHVILLDRGRVLAAGSPEVVRGDPRARARYFGG